jgi:magnesium-transporting ATPase (P-type)
VHNSIPEYVSTASISIVMTMPFHVMPFKKRFLKKWFSSQISSKPPSPQETGHTKKEKKEKEEEKEKLQESLQIKGKSIFWEEKNTSTSKISFLMLFHFLPLHHTISKTLSKIIENIFLALFGPSFNLTIYITWVVSFLFTHEL